MSNCNHEKYKHDIKLSWVNVTGFGGGGKNIRQLFAVLHITCSACGDNFVFRGQHGVSTFEPTISPDGKELRVPIEWPDNEDDDEVCIETIH